MADTDTDDQGAMPLIEHLAELRTRIIRSVAALLVGVILCFFIAEPALNFIAEPISDVLRARGEDPRLIFTAPQEKLFVLFRISILLGLGLSFPVIAYQMWRFVAPGLYNNERGAFLPFVIASPAMFLLGASFAHFVVTPLAMDFFIGFSDVVPALTNLISGQDLEPVVAQNEELKTIFLGSVRETLDISLKFIFAFGICFQLPILLTLMGKAGLVSADGLKAMRKYAVVGILVVAALVTPPDVITQVILFVVVYALYEISIWLVWWVERKRAANEEEEDEV